jgi:hypothetical protein
MEGGRLLTLALSLDHFNELLWQRFSAETCGCSLYRGSLESALLNEEALLLLAERLPSGLAGHVIVDASAVSRRRQAELFASPLFQRLEPIVKGAKLPIERAFLEECGGEGYLGMRVSAKPPLAVCLPDPLSDSWGELFDGLERIFEFLESKKLPYRLLAGGALATQWEGIETIIASAPSVSARRLLQGFAAAEGELVAAGDRLGIPGEISFAEWKAIQ